MTTAWSDRALELFGLDQLLVVFVAPCSEALPHVQEGAPPPRKVSNCVKLQFHPENAHSYQSYHSSILIINHNPKIISSDSCCLSFRKRVRYGCILVYWVYVGTKGCVCLKIIALGSISQPNALFLCLRALLKSLEGLNIFHCSGLSSVPIKCCHCPRCPLFEANTIITAARISRCSRHWSSAANPDIFCVGWTKATKCKQNPNSEGIWIVLAIWQLWTADLACPDVWDLDIIWAKVSPWQSGGSTAKNCESLGKHRIPYRSWSKTSKNNIFARLAGRGLWISIQVKSIE